MQLYDLSEFLKLSAVLNYQLSAKKVNWDSIATIICGKKKITPENRNILPHVFQYLDQVYSGKKRRLGPLSVLHPLRATALFSRAMKDPTLLDVLTALLHDNFEDIKPEDFSNNRWSRLDAKFNSFTQKLSETDRWYLMERLRWITIVPGETYYQYIGRLLDQAKNTPEVLRVKLADRLDNTLDMRIDLEDPLQGVDFFETIFQVIFNNSYAAICRMHLTPRLRH